MSETGAAFAERTIRSMKIILYRCMEDCGYKFSHKLFQFVTTLNSRKICSLDVIPKTFKISDFLSILYSKPLREYRKPKLKVADRVSISKFDLPFRKSYKPQLTLKVFEMVAVPSRKPLTYTMNDEQVQIIPYKVSSERIILSHITMDRFY